jgi:ribosome-associated translation inhibitor RaiA
MKLSWSLFTKNIRPHSQLRLKLQQKVSKLEKYLEEYPPDEVHLKVNLERHPKKYWFTASLALKLPNRTIRCAKFSDDPLPAFEQGVRALVRDLSESQTPRARRKEGRGKDKEEPKLSMTAAIAVTALRTQTPPTLPSSPSQ